MNRNENQVTVKVNKLYYSGIIKIKEEEEEGGKSIIVKTQK